MDGQQLIKSSQLKPGRHTWLARVPFGVAALGGGIGLIVAKTKGADQFWVTAAAIGLILAYAFIVYRVNALRLREDQLGDNCYYLGFLYTLASLAWALNEFGRTGAIEAIVSNFGLALGSTIVGILLRVLINQSRKDVIETERDARMELADAVVRMRVQIDDAVLALDSFCRAARQTATDQIQASATDAAKALETGIQKIGELSTGVLARIDSAFSEFRDHADELNKTSAGTVRALKALLAKIEKIDAPSDLVIKRLEPMLGAVELAASRLNERLEQDRKLLAAAADRSQTLDKELSSAVGNIAKAASDVAVAGAAAGEISNTIQGALKRMAELVPSTEAVIKEQARIADEARNGTEQLVQALLQEQQKLAESSKASLTDLAVTLRAHNDGLASELERMRRMVANTGTALAELAESVTERVTSKPDRPTGGAAEETAA